MTYDPNAGYPPGYPPGYVPGYQGAPMLPPQQSNSGQSAGHIFITVVFVALAFTAGWLGSTFANGGTATPSSARPYASDIWTAWQTIDNNYVDQHAIDHKKMTYAMITAMVNTLGDTGHSRFLSPDDVKQLNAELSNSSFVGIGVYLQTIQTGKGSAVIIEATIPNSPAQKAGLLPGDQFLAVDGTDVTGKTIDDLGPLVRGPANTTVSITVHRPNVTAPITASVKRDTVIAPIVESTYFAADHIGYVKITGFDTNATKELTQKLQDLQATGATSILLDLRGNPGGLVDEAIGVAGDFLPNGATVVLEKDRSGNLTPDKVGSSSLPSGLHLTLPMAILVDGGTASAAEIVTGAIQDNRPGTPVIGQRTFGTDTVLLPFELPDGSQLLLGTKQFLTPNKRQFKPGEGLLPSQPIALPTNAFTVSPLVLGELNLTETDVLACKGITVDTQLIAAIEALSPTRTSTCAPPTK